MSPKDIPKIFQVWAFATLNIRDEPLMLGPGEVGAGVAGFFGAPKAPGWIKSHSEGCIYII